MSYLWEAPSSKVKPLLDVDHDPTGIATDVQKHIDSVLVQKAEKGTNLLLPRNAKEINVSATAEVLLDEDMRQRITIFLGNYLKNEPAGDAQLRDSTIQCLKLVAGYDTSHYLAYDACIILANQGNVGVDILMEMLGDDQGDEAEKAPAASKDKAATRKIPNPYTYNARVHERAFNVLLATGRKDETARKRIIAKCVEIFNRISWKGTEEAWNKEDQFYPSEYALHLASELMVNLDAKDEAKQLYAFIEERDRTGTSAKDFDPIIAGYIDDLYSRLFPAATAPVAAEK